MRTRWIPVALLVLLAAPAAGQEREIRDANLPYDLETRLLRLYDRASTRHFEGNAYISPRELINGDVGARGGTLRLAGRIHGDLAMVDGDVVLERTSVVTGDVIVVGGEVTMEDGAAVEGSVTCYGVSTVDRDRDRRDDWDRRRDRWYWGRGHSRLTVRAGYNYNRVEGLPIMFGPLIDTGGDFALRLEALAIYRTESDDFELQPDRFGYAVKAEQFFGGRVFSVGGSVFSQVDGMDRWQVSDLEATVASLVFREDLRDYYDRAGWSGAVRISPLRAFDARFEYRQEDHLSLAAGNPWSLLNRGESWDLQPAVAEGRIRTVGGDITLDLRDRRDDPYRGWYINAVVEHALEGELVRPGLDLDLVPAGGPVSLADRVFAADFTDGFIDVRRYTPVGYRSQLDLRAVAGGSLTDGALPPQYQHALGGFGTLPGYDHFEASCGAHLVSGTRVVDGVAQRFFPSYGCDRFALFQAEFRGSLTLDFGFGDPDWDLGWNDWRIDFDPNWVVFFDAGRGWTNDTADLAGLSQGTGWLYDGGVGFLLGEFGIYAALPLTDDGGSPKFFVRLKRRF